MSATNRGAKRIEADFYATPLDVIENFLENHPIDPDGLILEPAAGNGNFVQILRKMGYTNTIIANEFREEEKKSLRKAGSDIVLIGDYLSEEFNKKVSPEEVKTIITNPPFSLALPFVKQSLDMFPNAEVIMLLRLAFLESRKRYNFWQENPVNHLYVMSQRPSFTGKGTDATAYGWFVWDRSGKQSIHVI